MFHLYQKKKNKRKTVGKGRKGRRKRGKQKKHEGTWQPTVLRNREVTGSGEDRGKQAFIQIYRKLFS